MDNNFSEMSNAELKLRIETLTNEYETKKAQIIKICQDMSKIETAYLKAKIELDSRKNLFI